LAQLPKIVQIGVKEKVSLLADIATSSAQITNYDIESGLFGIKNDLTIFY
jgi:hypothetical protein